MADYQKLDRPLYNSRIIKNYFEYVKKHYPEVDIERIINKADIAMYQLEDQGHWFSQRQVDRFNERLSTETQNPDISRDVGRYVASSESSGVLRQYALGFMTPAAAYWMLEKLVPHLSKAITVKVNKIRSNNIEILVRPQPDTVLKPYQCDNLTGQLEAVSKVFTLKYADIEHSECIHKGDDCCRYLITWEKKRSVFLKRIRNYASALGVGIFSGLFFLLSLPEWAVLVSVYFSTLVGMSCYSERLEKNELSKSIESQRNSAKLLLDEINHRYNDVHLIKEIGQATGKFLDVPKLLQAIINTMEKRLDFERGGIWLANAEKTDLIYNVGYGYNTAAESLLQNTRFRLDNPRSKGMAVQAFKRQEPIMVNSIAEMADDLSEKSRKFIRQIGSESFICAPIVYEKEPLGVILVDNPGDKKSLTQSDMSLLMGIAPQIAISLHNAMSYQELQESREQEKRLRQLFEKYVPSPIIKQYLEYEEVDLLKGEEKSITVLFVDIRGFTSSSERMHAVDVVSFLNDYFDKCAAIISRMGGHINKYTGDGFLAIFGAPDPLNHHTERAFESACKIIKLSDWFNLGSKPMSIGIGLHSGKAILGNIGSQTKIEYTAIGDTVNTAARLQELSKKFRAYPVIMSRVAHQALLGHRHYNKIENLGLQRIRGKKRKTAVFGFDFHPSKETFVTFPSNQVVPLQRISGV